jgi:hypothetical protein
METTQKPDAFQIVDESSASWALGKLAANRSERDRVQAMAAKRVAELDADYNSLMGRFGADLQAWAKEEAFRRRRKSVTLLDGVLSFRTVPPRIVLNEAAPEIAMTLGFVKPPSEPAPDVSAFRKHAQAHFEATGELLPGVERTEESEGFSIKFAAESKGETQEGGEA